jgi:hypothetical protein
MENTQKKFSLLIPLIVLILVAVGAYSYFTSDAKKGLETYADTELGIRFKHPVEWKVYKNNVGNIYYLFKESEGEVTDIPMEVLDKARTNIVVEVGGGEFTEEMVRQIINPSEFEYREMNGLNIMRFISTGFEVVSTTTKPYLTYALSSPFEGKKSIWITLHPFIAASSTAEVAVAEMIVDTFDITKQESIKSPSTEATTTTAF